MVAWCSWHCLPNQQWTIQGKPHLVCNNGKWKHSDSIKSDIFVIESEFKKLFVWHEKSNCKIVMFVCYVASHAKLHNQNSEHDEGRESVCFTRRSHYSITGIQLYCFFFRINDIFDPFTYKRVKLVKSPPKTYSNA